MKFEELSKKEQEFWKERAENLSKLEMFWIICSQLKTCIFCNTSFPDGITLKHPSKFVPLDAYAWFTPDYLVHCQTTHGYPPEIMTEFLQDLKRSGKK